MEDERFGFTTPFNVVAAFRDEVSAQAATAQLQANGIPAGSIREGRRNADDAEETAELRAEMREEMDGGFGGPTFHLTGDQAKGAFAGTATLSLTGALAGFVLGLAWAYLVDTSVVAWIGVMVGAGVGAIAGGTIGFIAGGGVKPRFDEAAAADRTRPRDDQPTVAERDVLVGVHSDNRSTAERAAAMLARCGAERVDSFDGGGTPLTVRSA